MEVKENAIYTYKELKAILRISRYAAEKLIKSGQLTPLQPGKGFLFSGSQILKWVKSQTEGTPLSD